jgi:hypothetical protein
MTDVATKNGSVIIKDGAVAERCGCCGCADCKPTQITVTIESNDFLRHSEWQSMYGDRWKTSWGIIAAPLSRTFTLSFVGESEFGGAWQRMYESTVVPYPGSGKVSAAFFASPGFFPGGITGHLFTVRIPLTVCRAFNTKFYTPSEYKFYELEEMLTPQYEAQGGATQVLVRNDVATTSTTFVCTQQSGSSRTYLALGGTNVFDGEANDAEEGASIPCNVWSFDPTTTDAVTIPNAQGYGYVRHYQQEFFGPRFGWTELSRTDVTTGSNVVRVSGMEFDCGA